MCLESWEKGGPGEKKLKIAWKPGIWARNIVHHTPLPDHCNKRKQVNQTKDIHSPNNVCFVHSSRLQRIFAPLRMQIETKMFVEAFQCFHVQTSGYIILCYSSYLPLLSPGVAPLRVSPETGCQFIDQRNVCKTQFFISLIDHSVTKFSIFYQISLVWAKFQFCTNCKSLHTIYYKDLFVGNVATFKAFYIDQKSKCYTPPPPTPAPTPSRAYI